MKRFHRVPAASVYEHSLKSSSGKVSYVGVFLASHRGKLICALYDRSQYSCCLHRRSTLQRQGCILIGATWSPWIRRRAQTAPEVPSLESLPPLLLPGRIAISHGQAEQAVPLALEPYRRFEGRPSLPV